MYKIIKVDHIKNKKNGVISYETSYIIKKRHSFLGIRYWKYEITKYIRTYEKGYTIEHILRFNSVEQAETYIYRTYPSKFSKYETVKTIK